eukprot:1155074-Pelagomonas_calceolata.AAC.3
MGLQGQVGNSRGNDLPTGLQPTLPQHHWSADSRETLFLVPIIIPFHPDFQVSVCHPIYDEEATTQALHHATFSAILNTEATSTFMFLPV